MRSWRFKDTQFCLVLGTEAIRSDIVAATHYQKKLRGCHQHTETSQWEKDPDAILPASASCVFCRVILPLCVLVSSNAKQGQSCLLTGGLGGLYEQMFEKSLEQGPSYDGSNRTLKNGNHIAEVEKSQQWWSWWWPTLLTEDTWVQKPLWEWCPAPACELVEI